MPDNGMRRPDEDGTWKSDYIDLTSEPPDSSESKNTRKRPHDDHESHAQETALKRIMKTPPHATDPTRCKTPGDLLLQAPVISRPPRSMPFLEDSSDDEPPPKPKINSPTTAPVAVKRIPKISPRKKAPSSSPLFVPESPPPDFGRSILCARRPKDEMKIEQEIQPFQLDGSVMPSEPKLKQSPVEDKPVSLVALDDPPVKHRPVTAVMHDKSKMPRMQHNDYHRGSDCKATTPAHSTHRIIKDPQQDSAFHRRDSLTSRSDLFDLDFNSQHTSTLTSDRHSHSFHHRSTERSRTAAPADYRRPEERRGDPDVRPPRRYDYDPFHDAREDTFVSAASRARLLERTDGRVSAETRYVRRRGTWDIVPEWEERGRDNRWSNNERAYSRSYRGRGWYGDRDHREPRGWDAERRDRERR